MIHYARANEAETSVDRTRGTLPARHPSTTVHSLHPIFIPCFYIPSRLK
jgi:hypothetical protein